MRTALSKKRLRPRAYAVTVKVLRVLWWNRRILSTFDTRELNLKTIRRPLLRLDSMYIAFRVYLIGKQWRQPLAGDGRQDTRGMGFRILVWDFLCGIRAWEVGPLRRDR